MKPYEEVCFPSGILRWIREGDEYVCRLTEDQINEIKEIHEEPWVKTYSGGKPNYTEPETSTPEFIAEQKATNEALRKMVECEPILPGGGIGRHPDIPIKVQDEREANYKSFAQSAQVLGAQYDPRREPSGSWVSWDNTMCNPLANARMQTQSAWQDGYDSAKAELAGIEPVAWMHTSAAGNVYFRKKPQDAVFNPQPLYLDPLRREWQGLTDDEMAAAWSQSKGDVLQRLKPFARAVEQALKEKNT